MRELNKRKLMLRFFKSNAIIISIMLLMLMLSGCVNAPASPTINVCPKPVIPTEAELKVLRSELPDFYVRFTNQQADLFAISEKP